ncbi:MAG TPA: hypothetical protein VF518_12675, partial [Polyangia bacterium]
SPGANAPIMYGTGPGRGNGEADALGTPADAAAPSTDGGAIGRSDAGASLSPDADPHTGGQNWIHFPTSTFNKCTWFSATSGLCSDIPRMFPGLAGLQLSVYKTSDGGKNWAQIAAVNTENAGPGASVNVYAMSPTDLWFTSGFAGVSQSGSIGHSTDGGGNWTSLTSTISALLNPAVAGDAGIPTVPIWQLAAQGGRLWLLPQGGSLATSLDNGLSWMKIVPPAAFAAATKRGLIVSQGYLLLQLLTANNSMGLYRWNGETETFGPVEGAFPLSSAGDHTGTWWRASPNLEGVLFIDRGPLPAWASPFWLCATVDGGRNFQRIPDTTLGTVVGLSDGLAFSSLGSISAYSAGIFSDSQGRYLEIHKTSDAGRTWSTVHSEPYLGDNGYVSLSADPMGAIHAMHYNLDETTSAITYDAHYVLR